MQTLWNAMIEALAKYKSTKLNQAHKPILIVCVDFEGPYVMTIKSFYKHLSKYPDLLIGVTVDRVTDDFFDNSDKALEYL